MDIAETSPADAEFARMLAGLASAVSEYERNFAPDCSDREMIVRSSEVVSQLEALKAACAAAQQPFLTRIGEASPSRRSAAGVIGKAMKISPATAQRILTRADALTQRLPQTRAALARGEISEDHAAAVATETSHLDAFDVAQADEQLATEAPFMSARQVEDAARRVACEIDPDGSAIRAERAVEDRDIWMHTKPGAMALFCARLPATQALTLFRQIDSAARQQRQAGDTRSVGQLRADLFVEATSGGHSWNRPQIELTVTIDEATLCDDPALAGGYAFLDGFGVIPGKVARDLVRQDDAVVKWRQALVDGASGALIALESRSRAFPTGLKRFLRTRDQCCRNPFCGTLIRHFDHIEEASSGGATSADNGQGLCELCNYLRNEAAWAAGALPSDPARPRTRHVTTFTAPDGRTYQSTAPPMPRARRTPRPRPPHSAPEELRE